MARADLIDDYTARLGLLLRWRPDADDVIAETEDHLRTAVERLVRAGTEPNEAQRLTLERFGSSDLVARSFATTLSGGVRLPTRFTRAAGHIAIAAALIWVIVGATAVFGQTELLLAWSELRNTVWSALACLAVVATSIALVGLSVRAGAARRPVSQVAIGLMGLSVGLFAVFSWFWPFGGSVLGAAAAIVIQLARAARLPLPRSAWLLVTAFLLGFVAFAIADVLRLGPLDRYGDYPVAALFGIGFSAALVAAPLVVLGNWLRAEEPTDTPPAVATR